MRLEPGTALRLSQINGLRREALEELAGLRTAKPFRRVEALEPLLCPAREAGWKADPGGDGNRTEDPSAVANVKGVSRYCCYVYGNTKPLYLSLIHI